MTRRSERGGKVGPYTKRGNKRTFGKPIVVICFWWLQNKETRNITIIVHSFLGPGQEKMGKINLKIRNIASLRKNDEKASMLFP